MKMLRIISWFLIDQILIIFYPLVTILYLSFFLIKVRLFYRSRCIDSFKIAIISPSVPPFILGGVSSAHFNLFLALKKNSYNVRLFSLANINNRENPDIDCNRIESNRIKQIKYKIWYVHNYFFKKIYRSNATQILSVLTTSIDIFRINKKLLNYNPDLIILGDHGLPGLFLSRKLKSKIIIIEHHNPYRFYKIQGIKSDCYFDVKLIGWFEKKYYKKITGLIFPSNYMKDYTIKSHNYKGLYYQIYNIIDTDYIDQIKFKEFSQNSFDFYIYIPSAGSKYKGAYYIFEIIEKLRLELPDKKLFFYLSGFIDKDLLSQTKGLESEKLSIFSPGKTSYEDNIGYIKNCNICISPTLVENFSMALLEANYCGLPVITFNIGGNSELIHQDKNGCIVDNYNIDLLASCAKKFLISDNDHKKLCKEHILKYFNVNNLTSQYIEFIKSIY